MSSTRKIIKNSIWLILQPLILNIISIFVTGYIARTLGKSNYGIFVFALSFVTMAFPFTSIGLRALTIRTISKNKDKIHEILSKMLSLRILLSSICILLVFIIINIMNYPSQTKNIVYIFSLIIIFRAISTTFQDVFHAFEKMKYVAYSQFVSGLILTTLSVIVLIIGYRLVAISWVYTFGSLITLIISWYFIISNFGFPKLKIDYSFWKSNLIQGIPFFFPLLVALVGSKIGIIFLSVFSGNISVGIYGAASIFIERLSIVPDGIGSAIFPRFSILYKESFDEAVKIFKKFYLYMILLSMPMALGISILSKNIIYLIYGSKYDSSILILQILAWLFFIKSLVVFQNFTMQALHKEKKTAKISIYSTILFIILNLLLIPKFDTLGAAIAAIISSLISLILLSNSIKTFFTKTLIHFKTLFKVIVVNCVMGIFVYYFKDNLVLSVLSGIIIYSILILALKIISINEIRSFINLTLKRKTAK